MIVNKKAKAIVDLITGENNNTDQQTDPIKAAATALGRKGGLKRWKGKSESINSKKRQEIAKKAAAVRWKQE